MKGFTLVGEVYVQSEIFTTYFSCDYEKCQGACCWANMDGVELDGGVVSQQEASEIRRNKIVLSEYCDKQHKALAITKPVYVSGNRHCVTLAKNGECIYMSREKKMCALKQAHADGKLSFGIPIMCQMYPIWTTIRDGKRFLYLEDTFNDFCKPAFEKGMREHVRVYRFCEEAIVRMFGEKFYRDLHFAAMNSEKITL